MMARNICSRSIFSTHFQVVLHSNINQSIVQVVGHGLRHYYFLSLLLLFEQYARAPKHDDEQLVSLGAPVGECSRRIGDKGGAGRHLGNLWKNLGGI